jgi:hypothetical protein
MNSLAYDFFYAGERAPLGFFLPTFLKSEKALIVSSPQLHFAASAPHLFKAPSPTQVFISTLHSKKDQVLRT